MIFALIAQINGRMDRRQNLPKLLSWERTDEIIDRPTPVKVGNSLEFTLQRAGRAMPAEKDTLKRGLQRGPTFARD